MYYICIFDKTGFAYADIGLYIYFDIARIPTEMTIYTWPGLYRDTWRTSEGKQRNKRAMHKIYWHKLQGTGLSCTKCVSHTGYLTHGNSKGESRRRSRYKNYIKQIKYGRKERGHYKGESPNEGLNSTKDLTVMLPGNATLLTWSRAMCRLHSWWCLSDNSFRSQLCNQIPPGTQRLGMVS